MKREVVEGAGLEIFAEIGIIIFMVVFVLVVARGFLMPKEKREAIALLPLDLDEVD